MTAGGKVLSPSPLEHARASVGTTPRSIRFQRHSGLGPIRLKAYIPREFAIAQTKPSVSVTLAIRPEAQIPMVRPYQHYTLSVP